jgi:protein-disulfide isomerase
MGLWLNKVRSSKVDARPKRIEVLIFGTDPPCSRCLLAERNAREAAVEFPEGLIAIEKWDAWSERARQFQITMTPTTVVNGEKEAVGKVLDPQELKALFQKIAAKLDA